MNDQSNNKAAITGKNKGSGLGCSVVLAILLVGLIAGAVASGPLLLDFVNNQTTLAPLAIQDRTSPQQLAARRQEEIAQLNGYGWVNKESGIAQIPIARAIALVAERGLPVGLPPTPTPAPQPTQAPSLDLSNVNYQDHVLPIFQQHCAKCHGEENPEEGLELTSYKGVRAGSLNGSVIKPGDPDNSYLVKMVVEGRMPKKDDPLAQSEIDTIIAWITAGAPEQGSGMPDAAPLAPALAISSSAVLTASAPTVDLTNVSFTDNVLPIFQQHCSKCHGEENPEEGLELTSYKGVRAGSLNGSVIKPGDPANSYLVKMVVEGRMPKKDDPLAQSEIDTIIAWITAGALEN